MKHFRWIETCLLVLLLIVIVLCIGRLLRDDSVFQKHIAPPQAQVSLADCPLSEEKIDGFFGVRRTYTFTVPSGLTSGDCLILRVIHQYCTVRVGGETRYLYEDDTPQFIRTSGRYWACVPISAEDTGKTVELSLTPVFSDSPVPEIHICPIDYMISAELSVDLPLLLLGMLCVVLGATLFPVAMFSTFDRRIKRALFCLSLLTVAAGVWKIAGLPVTTLLLRSAQSPLLRPKAIYLYGMIGFLLMPVLIIQFLNAMQRSEKTYPEIACAAVMALTAIVVFALQLLNVLELQNAVPFLMAESAVLMLCMLVLILRRRETIWLICFPICACADLLMTRLTGFSRYAVLLMLCILVSDFVSSVIFVRRTIRQRSELRDARATALLNQIRPHFIHNTLTSIYYLCDSDPQTAKQLVRDFNNHLRANFTSLSAKTSIPFHEELDHVRAYLSVEQVRFSDKLFVEYDTPHTSFLLPALTLQPLVENAVKHNLDSGLPPVHIRIRSYRSGDGNYVVVEDDGGGSGAPETAHNHVGLQNVADRLELLCGGKMTVSSRPDGGTVVTIFIPDTSK